MRAVMFDLFETLVSERASKPPGITHAAEMLGLDAVSAKREYRNLRQDRFTGKLIGYDRTLVLIAEKLGCQISSDIVAELVFLRTSAFRNILRSVDRRIMEMIETMRDTGLKIGVVSNTEASEVESWEQCLLRELVDVTVFSHQTGCMKPDRAIYASACESLGVTASECVYIGDGGSDELRGAANSGMMPFCATWFAHRDADPAWVRKRSAGYPILETPMQAARAVLRLK